MYIVYKIEKNAPEKAIAKNGDISYVCSIGGALASRFGTALTYTGTKEDAVKLEKPRAEKIAKQYNLEIEKV